MDSNIYIWSLGGVGIASCVGYYTYINRIWMLENVNFYYKRFDKYIKNLNPLQVLETYNLDSKNIYLIKLIDKHFIVSETNIDIKKYTDLKNSLIIPHTPEDILEATLTTESNHLLDITEVSKLLIGPFLNQFTQQNKKWIFEYLEKKHKYKNIKTIELMFINGNKIII